MSSTFFVIKYHELHTKHKEINAASSNGRALAPGFMPLSGFRETAKGRQYTFEMVIIGGLSHLYVPNVLLPAGGTMTITEY